jgi:hypothetical protein
VRAEHCFRTGFEEYIRNVAIPEHEHVAEADGFQLAGSAHMNLKLADSAGKLKTIGLGDMIMLWDGNVSNVLFKAGSEAVLSSH